MKKYVIPEIVINSFDIEDVITDSTPVTSAAAETVTKKITDAGVAESNIYSMDWQNAE